MLISNNILLVHYDITMSVSLMCDVIELIFMEHVVSVITKIARVSTQAHYL